jgi:hypothetical protein
MQAAAQFSGTVPLGGAARSAGGALGEAPSLDLQALCLSGSLPLCEIAAAARERMWREEATRLDVSKERSPAAEDPPPLLH